MRHVNIDGNKSLLVFEAGDEIATELEAFVEVENVRLASFTAISALSSVKLVAFDALTKEYAVSIAVNDQCEFAAMTCNISLHENKPVVHAPLVNGRRDGTAVAGHLKHAVVRPTCELFLTIHDAVAEKMCDERWKQPLYKL